jgi:hypothetical protein
MQRPSTKASLNNPVVVEKLAYLKQNWDHLSEKEKKKHIEELNALGCPNTLIGETLGKSESAIRYYTNPRPKKTGTIEEPVYYGNFLARVMDEQPVPTKPQPAVVSRKDQIKQAVLEFQRQTGEADFFKLQTLEFAKQRCDQYVGVLPPPVLSDVSPKAIFEKYVPADLGDPGAAVEFLAISLLRLLPLSHERDLLFRELQAKYQSSRLRY